MKKSLLLSSRHCEIGFLPDEAIPQVLLEIAMGRNPHNDEAISRVLFGITTASTFVMAGLHN